MTPADLPPLPDARHFNQDVTPNLVKPGTVFATMNTADDGRLFDAADMALYAKLAVREALERAFNAVSDEFIACVTNEPDASYNRGVKHSSQAIRAMIKEYK